MKPIISPPNVFDEIVHAASLHHDNVKAIQTIFAGRPELQTRLAALNPDRIGQRAVLSRSLYPFTARETQEYVEFRLACAGMPKQTVFPRKALEEIYERSQGFAPAIHFLCDRVLLNAFSATSKVCTQELRDQVFEKPRLKLSQIIEDASIALTAVRIYQSLLAPAPPPMQTALLRVTVATQLGSLRPRPMSTAEWPAHLAASKLQMVFPSGRFALAGAELGLESVQAMLPEACTKAAAPTPSGDLSSTISSLPVIGLSPCLSKAGAYESRPPGAPKLPACKLLPLNCYVRLGTALSLAPAPASPFPELFLHARQPMRPQASLQPSGVIPCSLIPLTSIRTTKHDPLACTAANVDFFPLSFASISEPTRPTVDLQSANIIPFSNIPCSNIPLTPFCATRYAPLPSPARRFVETEPANLISTERPTAAVLRASLHLSVEGPIKLFPLAFSAEPIPPPMEAPIRDLESAQPPLYARPPRLRLKPADPPRPSFLSPLTWIPRIASSESPGDRRRIRLRESENGLPHTKSHFWLSSFRFLLQWRSIARLLQCGPRPISRVKDGSGHSERYSIAPPWRSTKISGQG